ncbi:hypothetical protein ABZ851_30395 [Streptomyces sp. NPDC047049]|uniref:hypothetical protein n=1 Tax=Streptomyces sp. NPDC047049 TaxID=3156688 RepID=UPI0033DB7347
MTSRPYVEIPRPYEFSPDRFDVELNFPASSRKRAEQHQSIAWELARIHDVEAHTPYKINPRWSVYEENWGNGQRHGGPDYRRLEVHGNPRSLARYLAALQRVLTAVERLATRAARAFGSWRRSLLAQFEGHLEYEDPTTLRIRAQDFRSAALTQLTRFLAQGAPDAGHRDSSRPLWEQADTVAAEVWAQAGGVNAWEAPEDEVQEQLQRMLPLQLSVVEAMESREVTPQVPDTVEELLELSGPAEQAPAEHVPAAAPATRAAPAPAPRGHVPAGRSGARSRRPGWAGGRAPVPRSAGLCPAARESVRRSAAAPPGSLLASPFVHPAAALPHDGADRPVAA